MPPSYRPGLAFISDSQEFISLEQMLVDFEAWGQGLLRLPGGLSIRLHARRRLVA